MKKLSKLFVSILASAILSVTSASAIISIPDVKTLQNEDVMCDLVLDISKEYSEREKNCESLKELRTQILEICKLKIKYGIEDVAHFVVMLKAALEGKTEKSYLKSVEKINCDNFIIINDFRGEKSNLILFRGCPPSIVLNLTV